MYTHISNRNIKTVESYLFDELERNVQSDIGTRAGAADFIPTSTLRSKDFSVRQCCSSPLRLHVKLSQDKLAIQYTYTESVFEDRQGHGVDYGVFTIDNTVAKLMHNGKDVTIEDAKEFLLARIFTKHG